MVRCSPVVDIVSLVQRAEHPIGDGPQVPALLLEPFGQPPARRTSAARAFCNDTRARTGNGGSVPAIWVSSAACLALAPSAISALLRPMTRQQTDTNRARRTGQRRAMRRRRSLNAVTLESRGTLLN